MAPYPGKGDVDEKEKPEKSIGRFDLQSLIENLRELRNRADKLIIATSNEKGKIFGFSRPVTPAERLKHDVQELLDDCEEYFRMVASRIDSKSLTFASIELTISQYWRREHRLRTRLDQLESDVNLAYLLPNVEVVYAMRNDFHGQDAASYLINARLGLKGIVICDGVTNANGKIASRIVVETISSEFAKIEALERVENVRSQLKSILELAVERIRAASAAQQLNDSATTMLMAFTEGKSLYIFYIGDGTIRHFTQDLYSMGDYFMSYDRGGAMQGFVSGAGIISHPTFLYVQSTFTGGNILILATDGAQLTDPKNHVLLTDELKRGLKSEGTVRECLNDYLINQSSKDDDATIAAIWIKNIDISNKKIT